MPKYVNQALPYVGLELVNRGFDPFSNGASPDNALWRAILLREPVDPASLPVDYAQMSGHFVSKQVWPGAGYSGLIGPYTLPAATFDPSNNRFGTPLADQSFTASGGSVTFQGYVFIRGNKAIPPQGCTLSDQTFTANAHGYIDDDRITISFTDGGALPGGLTESLVVEVHSATANTFQVRQINNAPINLSTTGASLMVCDASGTIGSWEVLPTPETVSNGDERRVSFFNLAEAEAIV
ncbi:MAG: hypothetical protein AAF889_07985 [Cyanobacteria bacterium P01_D01_bin.73]